MMTDRTDEICDKEFLIALRKYIEEVEVKIDGECGMSRNLKRLIADGDMPTLYADVLQRLKDISLNRP